MADFGHRSCLRLFWKGSIVCLLWEFKGVKQQMPTFWKWNVPIQVTGDLRPCSTLSSKPLMVGKGLSNQGTPDSQWCSRNQIVDRTMGSRIICEWFKKGFWPRKLQTYFNNWPFVRIVCHFVCPVLVTILQSLSVCQNEVCVFILSLNKWPVTII